MVKLSKMYDNTIPFPTGERVHLAKKVTRVCHLRAGMRIVFKCPRWGRIMHIEPTSRSTVSKLLILTDETYVDEYGDCTNKLVWYVQTSQYGDYWCIYDVEDQYGMESIEDEEHNMEWQIEHVTATMVTLICLLYCCNEAGLGHSHKSGGSGIEHFNLGHLWVFKYLEKHNENKQNQTQRTHLIIAHPHEQG